MEAIVEELLVWRFLTMRFFTVIQYHRIFGFQSTVQTNPAERTKTFADWPRLISTHIGSCILVKTRANKETVPG